MKLTSDVRSTWSSGKTAVALLPPMPPPDAGAGADEFGDEEGPRETDEIDPPSLARETTDKRRALWLLRVKAARAGALDVATPPRTATTSDSDADADGSSGNEAPIEGMLAARAPHAFPRAAARMIHSLGFFLRMGARRANASFVNSARGEAEIEVID